MHTIRHEVVADDGLSRDVYQYWFDDRHLRLELDKYWHEVKPTYRHKWRVVARYERRSRGHSGYDHHLVVKRDAVPDLDTVGAEVLRKFVAQITVE